MIYMTNNYEELREYTARGLFKAAVRKIFEKKAVCLTVSVVAVIASLICMDLVRQYYQSAVWWIYGLFTLPFFTMFTAGVSGLISNVGRFGKRRFVLTVIVTGVLMWAFKTIFELLSVIYPDTALGEIMKGIGMRLLQNAPMLIVSLAVILLPVIISTRSSKSAQ